MFTYHLFHPYHIIPTVKLIAASVELSHTLIAEMLMKIHTGTGQVFIIFWCNCNAGVQVQNSHLCKKTLQGSIESASCTAAPPVMSHINRHLSTPAISSPRVKRRTIGISQDLSLLFCHNIRIFHLYIMDSLRKLFYGRCFVFKCDRSFFYVVGINL